MLKSMDLDRIAILFSAFIFLVYLSTLSISLDEEDAVHFALGLKEFNVSKYQPHPPGFPVYIGLGMLFNAGLKNELLSLTCMGALFGALSVFVFYMLAREMLEREIALASSVLMAFTPLFWLSSLKAMSDIPALFFTLASMLFIYKYIKYNKPGYFYTGALLAGISTGVRIHTLFILLPALVYSAYMHKKGVRIRNKGFLLFVIAMLAWLLPVMLITGIPEYLSSAVSQFGFRVGKPHISIIGTELTPNYLALKLFSSFYYFLLGGYGINLASLGLFSTVLLFFMAALAILFLKNVNLRDRRVLFLVSGVLIYLPVIFILLPPFSPRYLLVLIPLLSLIFTKALWNLKKPNQRYPLFGLLILLVLTHSIFLALEISTKSAPPVQLINYVNENYGSYGSEGIIILNGFASKYFTYYHTDLTRLSETETDCERIKKIISENKTVLSIAGDKNCEGLQLELVSTFKRDPRVHIKRSMINLYEFLLE
ncbi:MAG: glycosyltransferase family 39 protein [Candidatus Aenigmarchaeota archaeon]|nr:glycosyltransferase family 39 protein [Candidatus Aenigmarchaeota archaeon]